jgi:hypothetical protein
MIDDAKSCHRQSSGINALAVLATNARLTRQSLELGGSALVVLSCEMAIDKSNTTERDDGSAYHWWTLMRSGSRMSRNHRAHNQLGESQRIT